MPQVRAPKKPFKPGIRSLPAYFGEAKSHEEVVARLRKELARPKIRRMAGELARKKKFDYDSLLALKADGKRKRLHKMKAVRERKSLHAVRAGKHPVDARILKAYRGAGKGFRTRNELFWFLQERLPNEPRQTIEIRVRELIDAGIIAGFAKRGG